MKVESINNQTNFQGSITINGLSKSQQKAFDSIKDTLCKKVADKDYLILNINGSLSSSYISSDYRIDPKYILMDTQIKPATVPTASTHTSSLNPNKILKLADEIINQHLKSDLYKRAINGEFESFWTRIKKRFYKLFNKE